jgi:hypothetical protein
MENFGYVINLTPHSVVVHGCTTEGEPVVPCSVEPSGTVARLTVKREQIGLVCLDIGADGGIAAPLYRAVFGEPENLPAPRDNTCFIVSAVMLAALKGTRDDLVCPGEAVRDEAGRIIGCVGLSQ